MVLAVSSNARQQRRNLAQQPWVPTIDRQQNDDSRCLWMVGNERGSHEEQNPTDGVTQNRRKSRRSKVKQSRVSSFDRRCSGWFSAARMTGKRRSAFKLQIGTKLGQNGGRKWENGRVKVVGQVGFPGPKLGQLIACLSLSLCYTCMCFPLFPAYSFAYKLLNRLIPLYIHRCYMAPLTLNRTRRYSISGK